ncbi:hypothetical protein GCM10023165_31910 [Variovorax defluvii]|uniref:Uncharacterized protein n=1 Tax=Variovorax defluvii TaxID=913761 RepID=A0ABP8HXU9_9BURK
MLASDEAGFITGANLPVDGGALARAGIWGEVERPGARATGRVPGVRPTPAVAR